MPNLREELAKLATAAPSIREESTLRQYFVQALDDYVRASNLFSIDPGPLFRLDERIITGKPDSRLGALTFEVKLPKPKGAGLPAAVKQVARYIDEFAQKFVKVRGIGYDGLSITLLDEGKNVVFEGEARTGSGLLAAWLTLLAPAAKTPEDMVNRFGSASALSQNTIKLLFDLFERFAPSIPFIEEVYTIWKAVYGCAANLNKDSILGLRQSAKPLGIKIKGRGEAERFVFALETYLSILLKLLVARVAVEKGLVAQKGVYALICEPAGQEHIRYTELSSLIPHLANVFEEDPFDWFIDAARTDKSAKLTVCETLRCVAETIDHVHLVSMGQDFLRIFYQHFFDTASRRALGEFYTNDVLVKEALDSVAYDGATDKPIIDFCCGSGNFLVEVLNRVKEKGKRRRPGLLLADIQENVFGMDIHPLAVAMARVNFIIAVAPLLESGTKLRVPIFWGDSLARLVKKGKSRRFGTLGEPVNISIPGMHPFDLPDPEKFEWEKLFSFAKEHMGSIKGTVDFDRVWRRFEQEFPKEEVLPYENVLVQFVKDIVKRHNERRDTRWLPLLRNILFLERQKGKIEYVIGNPPWVRVHNIDEKLRKRINDDYSYCANAGWKRGCDLAGIGRGFARQTDLCVPFVERAFELLAPAGYLSFVITAKIQSSLYANALRRDLVTQKTIVRLSDYSLHPLPLFEGAVNYPLVISARNQQPTAASTCRVEITNSQKNKVAFELPQKDLSLLADDPESPWMMAPPDVVSVLRKMQASGVMLGEDDSMRPRMGIKTAANDIFVVSRVEPTDSENEVMVTTEGGETIRIEKDMLRPLIRGRDIKAWAYTIRVAIIWTHDDETAEPLAKLPKRAGEYFSREAVANKLKGRQDYKANLPFWCVFRTDSKKLQDKVCWKELANEMQATAASRDHNLPLIGMARIVPLHTTYLIPAPRETAILLASVFNSLPFRAFLMSFAPRARGGYYRHFSWTVGLTPVPGRIVPPNSRRIRTNNPSDKEGASRIVAIGERLQGNLSEAERRHQEERLNDALYRMYDLSRPEEEVLSRYYEFMRPPDEATGFLEESGEEEVES